MSKPQPPNVDQLTTHLIDELANLHPDPGLSDRVLQQVVTPAASSPLRPSPLRGALLGLGAVMVGVATIALHGSGHRPQPIASAPATHSPSPSPAATAKGLRRTQMESFFTPGGRFPRVDSVRSKQVHLSDLQAAAPDYRGNTFWAGQGNLLVWVVVMSGDVKPDSITPMPDFSWAIWVTSDDTTTQSTVNTVASFGTMNTEPAWFDELHDIGPP